MRSIEVTPRRWILMPIGHPTREFAGKSLLAFEAAERGWGTIFGRKALRSSHNLPRGILIEKNIAPGTAAKIRPFLKRGGRVSAWCEEGLVYVSGQEYTSRRIERQTYGLIDRFFCWGQNQADDVAAFLGRNSKLAVTGNPRMDLHRPEFRRILAGRAAEIRRNNAPLILINTRFSRFNGSIPGDALVVRMISRGKLQTKEQIYTARELMSYHRAGFEAFMKLIDRMSIEFPRHNIVIRPHPFEQMSPWETKSRSLPNVRVTREGNVAEWLLAAEVSIHTNCTSGVEAYLLGRPSISYRPIPDARFDMRLPNALSAEVLDIEVLIDTVKAALSGTGLSTAINAAEKAELVRHYIANAEGSTACARILQELDCVDVPEDPLAIRVGQRFLSTPKSPSRFFLHRFPAESAANKGSSIEDSVAQPSLTAFLATAQAVTGRFGAVSAMQLEEELFCVYAQ
jgi:surface carbohydrate biosynthesis protein